MAPLSFLTTGRLTSMLAYLRLDEAQVCNTITTAAQSIKMIETVDAIPGLSPTSLVNML